MLEDRKHALIVLYFLPQGTECFRHRRGQRALVEPKNGQRDHGWVMWLLDQEHQAGPQGIRFHLLMGLVSLTLITC